MDATMVGAAPRSAGTIATWRSRVGRRSAAAQHIADQFAERGDGQCETEGDRQAQHRVGFEGDAAEVADQAGIAGPGVGGYGGEQGEAGKRVAVGTAGGHDRVRPPGTNRTAMIMAPP
ncbi:hypothetical protein [Verrucosispora sp. WMMD573]|uniref:hypothetical protein n=1 Tax=Verrucosispora sp. WMMD573 TaxID=3015149 RepID=UPI00248B8A39|nr:hypothetical protein [Verrucosispora sp. WMMD573]WBB57652.1 hypothetical protein O7601_05965 [Verrucosispora sp. WMMD573]